MPRYRITTTHFFAPDLVRADADRPVEIEYDGPVTPFMEPLDEEAKKRMEAYWKAHPGQSANPIDDLPKTVSVAIIPDKPKSDVLTVGTPKEK